MLRCGPSVARRTAALLLQHATAAAAAAHPLARALHSSASLRIAPDPLPYAKYKPAPYRPAEGLERVSSQWTAPSAAHNAAQPQSRGVAVDRANVGVTMRLLKRLSQMLGAGTQQQSSGDRNILTPLTSPEDFAAAVVANLKQPFVGSDRLANSSFGYLERDSKSTKALQHFLSSPCGRLLLLEGSEGCGKSTFVEHALQESKRPAVCFDVREMDCTLLPPAVALAEAFGIELPKKLHWKALDILSEALTQHAQAASKDAAPPALVVDDAQRLLKSAEGRGLLRWCINRSCEDQLKVLFVASGPPVAADIQALSRYMPLLTLAFDDRVLSRDVLSSALQSIPGAVGFTAAEAERVVDTVGSNMLDVEMVLSSRQIGRTLDDAIQDVVTWPFLMLRESLTQGAAFPLAPTLEERVSPMIAVLVCQTIAAQRDPVALLALQDAVESEIGCTPQELEACSDQRLVSTTVDRLVAENVLRLSSPDRTEFVTFQRPVLRAAFSRLEEDEMFSPDVKTFRSMIKRA